MIFFLRILLYVSYILGFGIILIRLILADIQSLEQGAVRAKFSSQIVNSYFLMQDTIIQHSRMIKECLELIFMAEFPQNVSA